MKPLFTNRQREVLRKRAEGQGIKEIAFDLGITRKTVEGHWEGVRQKIGLRDVALITQWALANGLAEWKVKTTFVENAR